MNSTSNTAAPVDEALFERAWQHAFGERHDGRLGAPLHQPFMEALRNWHGALAHLCVPRDRRQDYDQRFIALAVDLCREVPQPCCVSSTTVRRAARSADALAQKSWSRSDAARPWSSWTVPRSECHGPSRLESSRTSGRA